MKLINADKLMEVVMATYLERWDLAGAAEGMSIVLDRIYNASTMNAMRMEKGEKNE